MSSGRRCLVAIAMAATFALLPSSLAAQAFTNPRGVGSVTVFWQYVDNTGHRLTDGYLRAAGQSVTTSAAFELEYGITDRLSATVGIPYVFAKYTGAMPPPSRLPVDACACWHSSFQDFGLSVRYRFGGDAWAVTPIVRYGVPSHDYPYEGEAVVGRDLQDLQVGVIAARKLVGVLPQATVQAAYTYSFVEKALDEVRMDRSNGFFDLGYTVTRKAYVHATANWQRTHGGLRFGSVTGDPFFPPGELNTPERFAQRDRVLRSNYWQVGGGLAYSLGGVDLFASVTKYVWGRDAHNGQAYNLGATWYFER